ncbi:MAG: anthranilate synthase component I [Chloroflexota bacterium]|nr:MAG: anthranilate synthase component I [Chloroflexota bacterium]
MKAEARLYSPSLGELSNGFPQGNSVVVSREILADLDTPVSAYLKIRSTGPSFLLESVEGGERLGRYSFIGNNPRKVLRVKDGTAQFDGGESWACLDPLAAVRSMVQSYDCRQMARARFEGGALGYLSYEAAGYFERLPAARLDSLELPDAAFMDVDTVLIFDHVLHKIRVLSHVWMDTPLPQAYEDAIRRIDRLVEALHGPVDASATIRSTPASLGSNVRQQDFEAMVMKAKDHIRCGDILQVVLSQRLSRPYPGDPFDLYRQLRAVSPSPYMYYIDFVDHQIVGASPELLLEVTGDTVLLRPIAGTRRRGSTPGEDEELAAELLADDKERAEHLMLVDLGRNDVGRVSRPGSVEVTRFMYVEHFSHVMHLVSDVAGVLRPECTSFDALRAAFPAGTLSGAPKIRAMQIIADLEDERRGPYGGAVGFINTNGDVEMAITIRTGVVKDGRLYVQAGAGIVADSVPDREFEETMNKAMALLEAAGGTR